MSEYSLSAFFAHWKATHITNRKVIGFYWIHRHLWKKKSSTKSYKICEDTSISAEKFAELRSLKSSRVVKVSISNRVHSLIPFVSVRIPVLLLERLLRKYRSELSWNVYNRKAIRAFQIIIDTEHNKKTGILSA